MYRQSIWFICSAFCSWQPAGKSNDIENDPGNPASLTDCSTQLGNWQLSGISVRWAHSPSSRQTKASHPGTGARCSTSTCPFAFCLFVLSHTGGFHQALHCGLRPGIFYAVRFSPLGLLHVNVEPTINSGFIIFFPLLRVKTDQSYWLFTLLEQRTILCLRTGLHCYLCANCQNVN